MVSEIMIPQISMEAAQIAVSRKIGKTAEQYSIDKMTQFTSLNPFTKYVRVSGRYPSQGVSEKFRVFVKYFGAKPPSEEFPLPDGYLGSLDPRREELVYRVLGGTNGIPRLIGSSINGSTGYLILEDVGNVSLKQEIEATPKPEDRRNLLMSAAVEIKNMQANANVRLLDALISGEIGTNEFRRILKPKRSYGARFIDYLSNLHALEGRSPVELQVISNAYESLFRKIDPPVKIPEDSFKYIPSEFPLSAITHGDCHAGNLIVSSSGRLRVIDLNPQFQNQLHDTANLVSSPSARLPYDYWIQIAEVASLLQGIIELRDRGNQQGAVKLAKLSHPNIEIQLSDSSRQIIRRSLPILVMHYSFRNLAKKSATIETISRLESQEMIPPGRLQSLNLENPSFRNLEEAMESNLNVALTHLSYEYKRSPEKKEYETVRDIILTAMESRRKKAVSA